MERSFGYRRLYVDAVLARAHRRGVLAVVSEVARLAFVVTGAALIAIIFWLLTAAAAHRVGDTVLEAVFALCAALSTAAALLAAGGIIRAARDMGRVRSKAEG